MPQLGPYQYTGPVDCSVLPDKDKLKDKSVIITGGANGIGEFYVRGFLAAGAFVTFGDVDTKRGKALEEELGQRVIFVKCDITNWDEQVDMFETAIAKSPQRSCDIVIANAGISRSFGDSLWPLDDPDAAPVKPALTITQVNMFGTMYTWKLAVHYFRKQPDDLNRDRCFLMMGSMTQFIDSPGNWEYTCTKYGLRGLMRTARRSAWEQGIRINNIAPYYVKSAIRTAEVEKRLEGFGVTWALPEDCVAAMVLLACDRTITGHSLTIIPRDIANEGFADAGLDDYEGAAEYFHMAQEVANKAAGVPWKRDL